MTATTLGRLLDRYLRARAELRQFSENGASGIQRRELQRRVKQLGDRLVVNYSPLVKYVAGRIAGRVPGHIDGEDLISWGVTGLLSAIETFDPGRKVKFDTYAISKIRWAIFDEMRRQDWVPRRVRLRAQEAERVATRLAQDLRRSPTEKEIAGELGLGVTEYRNFVSQYSRAQLSSLEARLEVEGNIGAEVQTLIADKSASDPQAEADVEDLRSHLVGAIESLKEQERLVATFYFYDGLTLKEIGRALGLTEGRISQILKRALLRLRENLVDTPLVSGSFSG